MGTLKVNGDISATGNISASSFLGNASSATYTYQWASTETNPSTSSTDSNTTTFNRSNSRIYWVDSSGVVLNQPSTWGYILDIGNNAERHQIWMTQNIGSLYHRGGNAQGWGCAWTEILDASNYTSYTVTKTGSGASGTWGINISGNAATTSKWATGRTFTIGETAKSVDGSSNMSWTIAEIGAPYVYHTQPSTTAYSYWGMLISRTRSTQGESGKGDNYYLGINSNSQLHIGHQLNGTSIITWTNILSEHNYSSYALPLSGGTMSGSPVIKFPASAGSIAASDPMAITYGRISAYGTLCINADSDGSTNEYLILTSGRGLSGSTADGLAIGYNTLTWQGATIITSGNYTSYCAPASHSHNYATLGAPNNLMHSGNEFTFAPAGYSGGIWFNYRTAGWDTNGNITDYTFGNGRGGLAPAVAQYFRTTNYGSGAPGSSTPGYGSSGAIYYQV